MNLQEIIAEVLEHLRGMWRYRWWAAGVAWLISLVGWFMVYSMPDVYGASARIYVDTKSLMGPVFEGLALRDNVPAQVDAVTRALLTRPNLENVARETDLDLRADTPMQMESLITGLQKRIVVTGNRERNVFDITFEDANRGKAREVVAAIVDEFVENSLQGQGDDALLTGRALDAELRNHENRLLAAEADLARFKRENLGYMPGEGGDYYARLQAAIAAAEATREEVRLLQERREELRRQIEGEDPVFGIMSDFSGESAIGCSQQGQIAGLEGQLASLQVEFTEKHPRIVSLRETIEQLREKCTEEREAAVAAGMQPTGRADQPLETNPVYQNLRVQLSDTEVQLATLRGQLAERQREVAQLREDVDKISQVETDLKKMNRDYGVVQARYQELLARKETLQSMQRLDPVADTVQFRILEPPFASTEPVGPDRPLLLVGVTLLAIAAGLVIAFALNQLHPVFYTRRSVRRVAGIPVLGSVSLLLSPEQAQARRRRAYVWATSYAGLLVVMGLVVAFESQGAAVIRQFMGGTPV